MYFYITGQAWASNQVPLKGVRIYFPTNDTAYNLRVVNADNTVESYKIEVMVEPPLGLAGYRHLRAAPTRASESWRLRRYQLEGTRGLATSVNLFVNDTLLLSDGRPDWGIF